MWKTNWRTLAFAPYSVLIPTLVAFGEIGIFAWMGWGTVRMVPVPHCWRSGVRRALAIRSGRTSLADVHLQRRRNRNGLFIGRFDFCGRRRVGVARLPSGTVDPASRIIQGDYLFGALLVVLAFALAAGRVQLSRESLSRCAHTLSDLAGGRYLFYGMANIAHTKLLAGCTCTRRWRFHLGWFDREYQDDITRNIHLSN